MKLVRRIRKKLRRVKQGGIDFGSLGGTEPVSMEFGFDRGTPIDRYYIEKFLADNSDAIAGRTLEIGDDEYTAKFGGAQTTKRDVLHIHDQNPHATIIGDLSQPGTVPEGLFDCAVITQTLHLIWDMNAAAREMHKLLKPGGTLLLTTPGITSVDRDEWGAGWYWSLTVQSATRMFNEVFGEENVEIGCYGNVFAACSFLQGIALHEVPTEKLDVFDPAYPMIVTVRARKAG